MKIDSRQWRFCKAIACGKREGFECVVEVCEHQDVAKALEERREVLRRLKNGRQS